MNLLFGQKLLVPVFCGTSSSTGLDSDSENCESEYRVDGSVGTVPVNRLFWSFLKEKRQRKRYIHEKKILNLQATCPLGHLRRNGTSKAQNWPKTGCGCIQER